MAFKCPHCSEAIENAMSQETHRERLKAKEDENKQLKTELTENQKKVKGIDAIVKERDELRADVTKRDAEKERGEAFAEAGIPDKVRSGFEAMYNSAVASAEEGKAPAFRDWLNSDEAKEHPLLSGHYGTPAGDPAADPGTKQPAGKAPAGKAPAVPPKKGLTNTDRGAGEVPASKAIDTPEKLSRYLQSAEYRAMTPAEQKKEIAALQDQINDAT